MRTLIGGIVLAAAVCFLIGSDSTAGDKKEPKHSIKEVMKVAMKGGLCAKVAGGKASDEEKKQLVELFTSLSKQKPPAGDAAAFKERAEGLLKAAKEGDGATLKKLANCGTCHKAFKG
jgi:hypothetical protein